MPLWSSGIRRNIKAVVLVGVGSNSTDVTFALPCPILMSEEIFINPLYSHVWQNINHVDIPNEKISIFIAIPAPHLRK